jgi:uncharacterized protein
MLPRSGDAAVLPALRQFVVKVHGKCNLACDYCYVYQSPDQGWRHRPRAMGPGTVRLVGQRIAEHAETHGLDAVQVTLHGGEPLLLGPDGLWLVISELRNAIADRCALAIGLQTNGLLLDDRFADVLTREGVRVGISLDGGREANDRHRRGQNGASSYERVVNAVSRMTQPGRRDFFAGILATIDPANDPIQLYHDLASLRPRRIDLLLPHSTWETPPPAARSDRTIYGDWLVKFFDAWYDAAPVIGVRFFEEIMHALLGGVSRSDAAGLSTPQSIVIETDGSYEYLDVLKIAYDGAATTGCTVADHSVDDVLRRPSLVANLRGMAGLAQACRECSIVIACGGGVYPHRYRAENGFDNPSVYCRDLGRLITHVDTRLRADLTRLRTPRAQSAT